MSFKDFNPDGDIVNNQLSTISEPLWSDSIGTLTTFFTGSIQSSNTGKYYYDVHKTNDQTTDVEFAVSYGHRLGYGSEGGTAVGETNPTKGIYSQLRQVLLPAQTTQFNFHGDSGANHYSDGIFIVSINRARYREKVDPGNWELHLTSGSSTIKLIDDSGASANSTIASSNREFWVVSGSVTNGVYAAASASAAATNSGSYGLFYPEVGIIILNPNSLAGGPTDTKISGSVIEPVGTSAASNDYNHRKLYNSIKLAGHFRGRREEQKRSSFYFCRVPNNEFNHSQNPSFFTGENAQLVHNSFITEPTTYITTVGLYNTHNELLAVAKLSQPFKKDQNTEALIKVRLDY